MILQGRVCLETALPSQTLAIGSQQENKYRKVCRRAELRGVDGDEGLTQARMWAVRSTQRFRLGRQYGAGQHGCQNFNHQGDIGAFAPP